MKAREEQASAGEGQRKSKTVCVEDPAVTMIEPDTMTPSQFFDRVFTDTTLVPEKRLMLAVLEDAIASFQRNFIQSTPGEEDFEDDEVTAWLESDDMSWPFSFASICQALNMEPEYLRRGLESWRTRTERQGKRGQVYRFPFRRVNGRRHSINAKRERRKTRKAG
ncbi:MAG: hypothetical protein D6760_02765 [Deltaproteobacteria bacterium]|nr:MAG: hypothetical protein D6760_02765 [Deltaproteobacteria bacterium]